MVRQASTTAQPSVKLQTVTSMPRPTVTLTRTPEVAGRTPTDRNPAHRVGAARQKAADRRPLVEVVAVDGGQDRIARGVRPAWVAVVAGVAAEAEVAGEPKLMQPSVIGG